MPPALFEVKDGQLTIMIPDVETHIKESCQALSQLAELAQGKHFIEHDTKPLIASLSYIAKQVCQLCDWLLQHPGIVLFERAHDFGWWYNNVSVPLGEVYALGEVYNLPGVTPLVETVSQTVLLIGNLPQRLVMAQDQQ